jgi:hypothetical protein
MTATGADLVTLWKSSPQFFHGKALKQIIGFAGSGKLRHGNDTSHQFRTFLYHIPSEVLSGYANECLTEKFTDNGLALQDVVNQVGRRIGFDVVDGRYTGVAGSIGFDGMWRSSDGHSIIVEVKTTDAFSIDLDKIAGYRRSLIREGAIDEDHSSILIVCGRDDTGNLESQVRGSRHAWDIRLISVDALLRLMQLKERLEDPSTIQKIRDILVPREYTRVDGIIDLAFSTTEESQQAESTPDLTENGAAETPLMLSPELVVKAPPAKFHAACIERIQSHLGINLIRHSQATFITVERNLTVICAVSRLHGEETSPAYWFAFHPHQRELLEKSDTGYAAFGCGSPDILLLIPAREFISWLDGFWITKRDDRFYWHVRIRRQDMALHIDRRHGFSPVDVTRYRI